MHAALPAGAQLFVAIADKRDAHDLCKVGQRKQRRWSRPVTQRSSVTVTSSLRVTSTRCDAVAALYTKNRATLRTSPKTWVVAAEHTETGHAPSESRRAAAVAPAETGCH